jgi:hypothetical protein
MISGKHNKIDFLGLSGLYDYVRRHTNRNDSAQSILAGQIAVTMTDIAGGE